MTSPRILLAAYDLHPKKQLGQNFLCDPSVAQMIADRAGICPDDVIIEIGAGLGALTIPLAHIAKKVYAVDKDAALLGILKTEIAIHSLSNVLLLEKDILKLDFCTIAADEGTSLLVMGNLPYNISSQILIQLMTARSCIRRAVVMLQRELAERITASPGGKDYGRITAMLRYCSDIRSLGIIKSGQFFPRPKIDSEVVDIRFRTPMYPAKDEPLLFRVIKAAFGQRRKTLRNALIGSELHLLPQQAQAVLEQADIDPMRRAETLEIDEFVRLSDQVSALPETGSYC